ncbi:MAG: delta-aminolevulinic acid dehydratase [Omnitrophica WOR_2 bacterium RIFCSPLOWO2_02_FULL_45_28]|nr:MAG: delta-aminolevulinic acid dehydratase [Omnitrophica WOR_2 bacterium RIFCSPLOWO2_02_FULL_45_28]
MHRLRRLRKSPALRELAAQVRLNLSNLVMPYFVSPGKKLRQPIKSLPGIFRLSGDELLKDVEGLKRSGINAIILFGIPRDKDDKATNAYDEKGIVQRAVASLKKNFPDLAVVSDVCLCGYTSHGHCGIIKAGHKPAGSGLPSDRQSHQPAGSGLPSDRQSHRLEVDNDETLKVLAKIALSHARAGADIVAPSSMMDGQVDAIRRGLDANGFEDTAIMGYSAKFASNFYGPFREAADSGMQFGDRKSYQMDFRNANEPLREIEADIQEGADIVMVKPALAYLDIIVRAKEKFNVPIAAYNVSGEYSMVKAYCQKPETRSQKPEAEKELALEILTAIKRAGADIIISYWAKDAARWLK